MKKYDVTLAAHYKKNISVQAGSPAHAREKIETILFDTDLIDFTDKDFICGEATITAPDEDDYEKKDESFNDDGCSGCAYQCPVCGECMYEDED
ncbi:MAG TPA: hypothetical protein DEP23_12060 [Ruminococcaceae bacterium]|nr:hypothetical protein [Oscillospiraceae bacterium]